VEEEGAVLLAFMSISGERQNQRRSDFDDLSLGAAGSCRSHLKG